MDKIDAFLRKLNTRERALCLIVVLAVAALLGKALVWDQASLALAAGRKAAAADADAARSRDRLAELAQTAAERRPASVYAAYRKENSGLGNFVRRLSSGGEGHRDLVVRRISAESSEKLPEYDKTKFEVEVEGPFETIGAFLEDLESSQFLTRVESVHVFRIEKELRLCRAKILVNSYSWREL